MFWSSPKVFLKNCLIFISYFWRIRRWCENPILENTAIEKTYVFCTSVFQIFSFGNLAHICAKFKLCYWIERVISTLKETIWILACLSLISTSNVTFNFTLCIPASSRNTSTYVMDNFQMHFSIFFGKKTYHPYQSH